jgi:hypothetical protein
MKVLSTKELHQSGLLYHLNETAFWPLGLALTVTRDGDEYKPEILVQDFGEVVQDPDPEIRAQANQWLAERYKTVKP